MTGVFFQGRELSWEELESIGCGLPEVARSWQAESSRTTLSVDFTGNRLPMVCVGVDGARGVLRFAQAEPCSRVWPLQPCER